MAATAIFEKFQMAISPQPVIRCTSCLVIGCSFRGRRISNGAIFDSNKFKMAAAAILDNFEWPYLYNGSRSAYIARIARRAVIFAIAQLSCILGAYKRRQRINWYTLFGGHHWSDGNVCPLHQWSQSAAVCCLLRSVTTRLKYSLCNTYNKFVTRLGI